MIENSKINKMDEIKPKHHAIIFIRKLICWEINMGITVKISALIEENVVLTLLVPNQKLHSSLSANIYKIITAQKRLKLPLT